LHAALYWLLLTAAPAAPDTLVFCPAEFRPALVGWEAYRRGQGHVILIADPPRDPASLKAAVRRVAQTGRLKYLLLIGDVPGADSEPTATLRLGIPTNYVSAKINTRWGSEPTIATDTPYADIDGDNVPDLAVGRIAADSVDELAAFVSKVIRYEQAQSGDWQRRLHLVVGAGGLGAVTDAVVEAAGRHIIQQTVPGDYEVRHTQAHARTPSVQRGEIRSRVRDQLSEGSLAWVYLGHGLPTELDHVPTANGMEALLSVSDVADLHCGSRSPLAVLVACYTGAIDAPRDCLAEELSLAADGPVAVIAATRVSMPYGNTVLGYELLRACFQDGRPAIGDILLLAQQRTKRDAADDRLRESLDAMCRGLSPPPVDLAAERAEHVLMYHLLGDPLLRLRRPAASLARTEAGDLITK
jgi:hypothetical protein